MSKQLINGLQFQYLYFVGGKKPRLLQKIQEKICFWAKTLFANILRTTFRKHSLFVWLNLYLHYIDCTTFCLTILNSQSRRWLYIKKKHLSHDSSKSKAINVFYCWYINQEHQRMSAEYTQHYWWWEPLSSVKTCKIILKSASQSVACHYTDWHTRCLMLHTSNMYPSISFCKSMQAACTRTKIHTHTCTRSLCKTQHNKVALAETPHTLS